MGRDCSEKSIHETKKKSITVCIEDCLTNQSKLLFFFDRFYILVPDLA